MNEAKPEAGICPYVDHVDQYQFPHDIAKLSPVSPTKFQMSNKFWFNYLERKKAYINFPQSKMKERLLPPTHITLC
jgi:hypothetical protein